MRARLLQNTSAHPFGQGTIIEVAEEDVLRYPRIYQAVEAEELASATIDRIREAQIANAAKDFQMQKNALAREDAQRMRGQAVQLRQQAEEMARVADAAEAQAAQAEEWAQGLTTEPPIVPPPPPPVVRTDSIVPPTDPPVPPPPHRGKRDRLIDVTGR